MVRDQFHVAVVLPPGKELVFPIIYMGLGGSRSGLEGLASRKSLVEWV